MDKQEILYRDLIAMEGRIESLTERLEKVDKNITINVTGDEIFDQVQKACELQNYVNTESVSALERRVAQSIKKLDNEIKRSWKRAEQEREEWLTRLRMVQTMREKLESAYQLHFLLNYSLPGLIVGLLMGAGAVYFWPNLAGVY